MPIDPEAAGFAPEKLDRLTHHLESRYVTPKKIAGCSLRIVRKGITAHDSTLGLMDIERDKPMRTDTIFRIYSMTKPLTSVALMMLFEEGQLQLTDPVYKFIPSWRQHRVWVEGTGDAMATRRPVTPMTIQHLLSHTAGLTYGGFLPGLELPVDPAYAAAGISRAGTDTLEEFVQKLSQVPLLYEPGSQWSYSLATDVCGHLIEVISGKPLEEFLRERLFEPLDMPDTGFSVPDHKLDRFAACYERAPDKSLRLQDDPTRKRVALHHGGLCSLLRNARQSGAVPRAAADRPHPEITWRWRTSNDGVGFGLGFASPSMRQHPEQLEKGISIGEDYAHFSEMLVNQGQFRGRQLIGRPTLDLMTRNHCIERALQFFTRLRWQYRGSTAP